MGSGYGPTVLEAGLGLLGLVITRAALAVDGPPVTRSGWRPLILVLGAACAFALLIGPAGWWRRPSR